MGLQAQFNRKSVAVRATRDMTAATGVVSYTGFGGRPKYIKFKGCVEGTRTTTFGLYDGTNQRQFGGDEYATGAYYSSANAMYANSGVGATGQYFTVTSLDADGFTGTWTKAGTPAPGTLTFDIEAEVI
jgi:hypothetical protein